MTRLILFFASAGALAWSLLAWGAWALVDWLAGISAANAPFWLPPELASPLTELAGILAAAGFVGIILVWLLGLLGILAIALLGGWIGRVMHVRLLHELPPNRGVGPNERLRGDPDDHLARAARALLHRLQQRR